MECYGRGEILAGGFTKVKDWLGLRDPREVLEAGLPFAAIPPSHPPPTIFTILETSSMESHYFRNNCVSPTVLVLKSNTLSCSQVLLRLLLQCVGQANKSRGMRCGQGELGGAAVKRLRPKVFWPTYLSWSNSLLSVVA